MSIGENGEGRHLLSPNHLFWNWALFDFSCTGTFPVLSSLRNYQDLGEMTLILCFNFYLKIFCPLLIVMACRMFWTDLFANLCNMPSCRLGIQSPTRWNTVIWVQCPVLVTAFWRSSPVFFMVNICLDHALLKRPDAMRRDWNRNLHYCTCLERRSKLLYESSFEDLELCQLCFDLSQDLYIAYRTSNDVVGI